MTAPTPTAELAATYTAYRLLDEAYRAGQARIALTVARMMLGYWRQVDPANLAGTSTPWIDRSLELIQAAQARNVDLANAYTLRVRELAAPAAPPFTPPDPTPPNVEQIRRSIEFTGVSSTARELYRLESSTRTAPEADREEAESAQRTLDGRREQLMREAIARATAAAVRHVTTAGHEQIQRNIETDTAARGWVRTTKPGCCYFCAMLASRGAVYSEDSFDESDPRFTGPGQHKIHDSCGCGLRPVYSTTDPLPDRVEELDALWAESGRQRRAGESAVNAFRRLYEASDLSRPPAQEGV